MSNTVTIEAKPAGILFGQPVRGNQQAGWFIESELDAARKARNSKTLACLSPIPAELADVVTILQRGRIENGQVALSKTSPDTYAKLLAATAGRRQQDMDQGAAATAAKAQSGDGSASSASKPAEEDITASAAEGWNELKVGDLVLARWGVPDEGWWPARVLKIDGESFTLAWVDETEPSVRRVRSQVALIHPQIIAAASPR